MKTRIRDLREDRDMKQSGLAVAAGIDQRTISNYETGKTSPDAYALVKFADYFDVSIDYLVGRTDIDLSSLEKKLNLIDRIISFFGQCFVHRCQYDLYTIFRFRLYFKILCVFYSLHAALLLPYINFIFHDFVCYLIILPYLSENFNAFRISLFKKALTFTVRI